MFIIHDKNEWSGLTCRSLPSVLVSEWSGLTCRSLPSVLEHTWVLTHLYMHPSPWRAGDVWLNNSWKTGMFCVSGEVVKVVVEVVGLSHCRTIAITVEKYCTFTHFKLNPSLYISLFIFPSPWSLVTHPTPALSQHSDGKLYNMTFISFVTLAPWLPEWN